MFKIHILNNNNQATPSAPRNYGLKPATAPYLAFLDADDSFTPDVCEMHCFISKKNNTQMVCGSGENMSLKVRKIFLCI